MVWKVYRILRNSLWLQFIIHGAPNQGAQSLSSKLQESIAFLLAFESIIFIKFSLCTRNYVKQFTYVDPFNRHNDTRYYYLYFFIVKEIDVQDNK